LALGKVAVGTVVAVAAVLAGALVVPVVRGGCPVAEVAGVLSATCGRALTAALSPVIPLAAVTISG